MSILIKGMEKPEACIYWDEAVEEHKYCPFLGDSGYCVLQGVDSVSKSYPKMYQDCPLIEIPTLHGRLIDADMLEKECCHGCKHEANKYSNCIDCALANAPTVIEAEDK